MAFQPGQSGNPAGRKPGSKNRKTILREQLEQDGSELAELIKAKARGGDSTCIAIWAARLDPPMRSRGEPVEFELDVTASLSTQTAQVIKAISEGALTIEEGKQITDSLRQLAEIQALEGGGSEADRLVEIFRRMAQSVDREVLPYNPPNGVTTQ